MSRDTFRADLETVIKDISLDSIKSAVEKLIASGKAKDIAEQFLGNVKFRGMFQQHPLVGKVIDWGNASRKYKSTNAYKKLQDKLARVLEEQRVKEEDLYEIRGILRELRAAVIDFIEGQASDAKEGLRHIHAPGSVAKSETRNLYFGEKFTPDDLYKLASRFCRSIAFGDNIGVYSEDKDFLTMIKQLVNAYGLGEFPFRLEGDKLERELGIQRDELEYPYVVFLKFIMWLRDRVDVEEDPRRELCLSILNKLQSAPISIFFMPPDREKWCTISFPRLDFFINSWVQREETRKALKTLVNNISNFIREARREARRRGEAEKVRNAIDLLMNNYELLCRKLIEYGAPDFYALRNIMDIAVDLSTRYGIKLYFKSLTLAI